MVVSLVTAIRDRMAISLAESKSLVDGLLLGNAFHLAFDSRESMLELKRQIESLGVVCYVVGQDPPTPFGYIKQVPPLPSDSQK